MKKFIIPVLVIVALVYFGIWIFGNEDVIQENPVEEETVSEKVSNEVLVEEEVEVPTTVPAQYVARISQTSNSDAENIVDQYLVRHALYEFHDLNLDAPANINLVEQRDGYMKGSVAYGDVYGVSDFYAYKTPYGGWKVTYDGVERPPCKELSGFPSEVKGNCF